MGCCGAKEQVQGASFVAGRTDDSWAVDTIKPTLEQRLAKRAVCERLAALPEHLRLGITLPGMRELLKQLPPAAVEQVNAKIPRGPSRRVGCFTRKGKRKFPKNVALNGYCNQYFMTLAAKEAKEGQPEGDKLAVCERLLLPL